MKNHELFFHYFKVVEKEKEVADYVRRPSHVVARVVRGVRGGIVRHLGVRTVGRVPSIMIIDRKLLRILAILGFLTVAIYFFWIIEFHFVNTESNNHQNIIYNKYTEAYILNFNNNNNNSVAYQYPTHLSQTQDYEKLIDLDGFKFTLLENVCSADFNKNTTFSTSTNATTNRILPISALSPTIQMLIVIHSGVLNVAKRATIRETWASALPHHIRMVFAIGTEKGLAVGGENSTLYHTLVREESELHHDLVQGNFDDTYRNMTYKHVMALKFAVYHCPVARYVLKLDDDAFVNTPVLVDLLKQWEQQQPQKHRINFLLCTIRTNAMVFRSYRSKWRVTFEEYQAKYYPTYCPGWNILYSADVVYKLYLEAQRTPYFWIDDVHVTGTLAKKASISHTNVEEYVMNKYDHKRMFNKDFNVTSAFLYGRSDLNEKEMRRLWNFVNSQKQAKIEI